MKKLFTLFLALTVSVGTILAESGTCGVDLIWDLKNGVLTISGSGAMNDFSSSNYAPWYSKRESISKVVFNLGATSIGNYAFYGCNSVTSIKMSNSITSIGEKAFTTCKSLTSIEIPNSVTSIGASAFSSCNGFTSIEIPNSVTNIGEKAFQNCTGLTSVTLGNSVTCIEAYAFDGCTELMSITIPNSVTNIGEKAFYNCNSLASIEIPNSVTSIGASAFYSCIGFTSIDIPNSVTSIGSYAFNGCSGLKSVTIPSSVTSIESYAFKGCNLMNLYYLGDIKEWCEKSWNLQVVFSNPYTLFLKNKEISDLTIPDSVTSIKSGAFAMCNNLRSIIIGNGVISIGYSAFSQCGNLASVVIGNGVTSIGNYAFSQCDNLASVAIGNSVTSIGDCAFIHCGNLASVVIGNSVTSIEYRAFYGCVSLKSVTIPRNVQSIGSSVFGECTNLSTVVWNAIRCEELKDGKLLFSNAHISSLIFGDEVEFIPNCLCYELSELESIIIPENVTEIGSYGNFENCTNLKHLKWNAISCNAPSFSSCPIVTCIIGDKVKTIPQYFCDNVTTLESVYVSSSVQSIGNGAFSRCKGLKRVDITDLTAWCKIFFLGNPLTCAHNLYLNEKLVTNLIIPEGITSISRYAFSGGSCLTSVEMPNSVRSIGTRTFEFCTNIEVIKFSDNLDSIETCAFVGCNNLTYVDIPRKATFIGQGAFSSCEKLVTVNLPDSLDYLAPFSQCTALKNVRMPRFLRRVGHSAFLNCASLASIMIPDSVNIIDDSAFEGCSSLESVIIPEMAETISYRAFLGCTSLTTMTIPNSVVLIGNQAWDNCEQLKELIMLPETPPASKSYYNIVPAGVPIYVPCGTLDVYKASSWSQYNLQYRPNIYALDVSPNDASMGTVSVSGNSCSTKLVATNNSGYYFVQWSDGNTENPREITLTEDTTLVAVFASSEPTAINNTEENQYKQPIKVLENGSVNILMPNGTKYSVFGELIR